MNKFNEVNNYDCFWEKHNLHPSTFCSFNEKDTSHVHQWFIF